MFYKHRVGDVCLTINTNLPAVNDGILVVVLKVDFTMRCHRGVLCPYLIRRVDGLPFVGSKNLRTGTPSWCKYYEVWSTGFKLKPRVDPNVKEDSRRMSEVRP